MLRIGTGLAVAPGPMQSLGFVAAVVLVSACSESGAHLTLSAPDGPKDAATFRLILATPEHVPEIANQRVNPSDDATQTVPYFLQRTIAGAEPIDHVDGLRIRLAPDVAMRLEVHPVRAALRQRGRDRRHRDVSCARPQRAVADPGRRRRDRQVRARRRAGRAGDRRWSSRRRPSAGRRVHRRCGRRLRAASRGGRSAAASFACCSRATAGSMRPGAISISIAINIR